MGAELSPTPLEHAAMAKVAQIAAVRVIKSLGGKTMEKVVTTNVRDVCGVC